jgi:hypothetical protein
MGLTKTNTDHLCCPTTTNSTNTGYTTFPLLLYFTKLKYRYYLWTGLYMLEPHERVALHVVVGPIILALLLYVGVFINGVRAGFAGGM